MSDAFQIRYQLLVLAREIVTDKSDKPADVDKIIEVATKLNKFVSTKNPG